MKRTDLIDLATRAAAGYTAALGEFADLAESAGFERRHGGWIYTNAKASKPIARGWQGLARTVVDGIHETLFDRLLNAW